MKTVKLGAEALLNEEGGIGWVTFPRLAGQGILQNAVSTRLGGVSSGTRGSLNLSFKVGDEAVRVQENRDLLSRLLGSELRRASWVDQVHGDRVARLDGIAKGTGGGSLGEGDGIITDVPNATIAIMVADCLPLLFFDPVHKAVGVAHAGWRGTVSHIAAKTLLAMGEAFGTDPSEARVVLGPCIGPCCYEVGADVQSAFSGAFSWGGEVVKKSSENRWNLDLSGANERQLLDVGMKDENIIRSGLCTVKYNHLFYSHRAEASPGKGAGRVGVFLTLKD